MGEMVEFPSNGSSAQGYLAPAVGGSGPGVIVIQEWWGLVPHIKDIADRLAAAGFTALAPDLFRGASTTEPDEAGKLMMSLNMEQAGRDLGGAVDFLKAHEATSTETVGVIGFCMGGGLTFILACQRPDDVSAITPFYGVIPWEHAQPDYSKLRAAVQGHFAENDGFFTPDLVRQLEQQLRDLGKEAELFIHPGVDHAFLNDTRPEVHDPATAEKAWASATAFLKANIAP